MSRQSGTTPTEHGARIDGDTTMREIERHSRNRTENETNADSPPQAMRPEV